MVTVHEFKGSRVQRFRGSKVIFSSPYAILQTFCRGKATASTKAQCIAIIGLHVEIEALPYQDFMNCRSRIPLRTALKKTIIGFSLLLTDSVG
ncbi:MAG: hypothetical protein BA865_15095 [Desulfobacterales bacterium S5133MH4]|nr:MAG: hypothetical protein BA865_15095 [Desulfobacterales bacterium S5133MH4]